jgi:hypothetical protein
MGTKGHYGLKVRLTRLRTDNCCPVTLLAAFPIPTDVVQDPDAQAALNDAANATALVLERRLHKLFENRPRKGEWFACRTWAEAARYVALAKDEWARTAGGEE